MLEQLNDMAVERPKQILGTKLYWGLDQEEIQMQIAKIRASLPTELKQAVARVRESERIVDTAKHDADQTVEVARREAERALADARKEAERIIAEGRVEADRAIEQGRQQQERMVSESEILKLSKAQAEEIRNSADKDAAAVRRGAENYAYDVLSKLEGVVGKVVTAIDRGKAELDRPIEPVALVNTTRERTRV
ncbi:MAG: hypothetical protein KF784_12535 [Fimbriimonadaceae bacterium]|nr:hypothetical protein [Fimbriimonadaceae bacterium]